FELAVAASLMALGLPPASAVAAALALHLVLLSMLLLAGAVSAPIGLLAHRHGDFDTRLADHHGDREELKGW
ncbi:MAG: hypothetical protein M1582_03740, partial [Actinobacteria bacterium]|nr:hypothetical protein [Actinomycetota bacterium]